MIEEIRIQNLGVIEEASIEFSPGLTAITGETGAGKTMLVTGLNLILGGKADPGTVRLGQDRAAAESRMLPPGDHPALDRATEAGAVVDEGALIITRTITGGRSRAYVGGRSLPQAILAEITGELVTVHGQSDQLRLRSRAHQRDALDEFAGPQHQRLLGELADQYRQVRDLATELHHWDERAQEREREILILQRAIERIETAAPEEGEQTRLREESERLSNIEELRLATATAHGVLTGDIDSGVSGIVEALHAAKAALEGAGRYDSQLQQWAHSIEQSAHVLADLGVELSSYGTALEADPNRLEEVHQRRALLAELSRDYANQTELDADAAVLEHAEWAKQRLGELTDPGQGREGLQERLDSAQRELTRLAGVITEEREQAGRQLEEIVNAELSELAMAGATFHVVLNPSDQISPTGAEDVEFEIKANRGGAQRPLATGASGGELSRVMLALEVALASRGTRHLPTFIFDEIDAGVGGKAAIAIGRRLAQLAQHAQVIVVTHLAQVAAFADVHVVVTKSTTDGTDAVTNSNITTVESEERISELARMLSGDPGSDVARAHAAELISRQVVAR